MDIHIDIDIPAFFSCLGYRLAAAVLHLIHTAQGVHYYILHSYYYYYHYILQTWDEYSGLDATCTAVACMH